jgi:ABC-type transport system involved in cytochrome bd biosynthesis fused ATPase/permease subunit
MVHSHSAFVLYIASVTIREELRLRVFEKLLRKTLGRRREEVTGEWRKLHFEELHDLLPTQNSPMVIEGR